MEYKETYLLSVLLIMYVLPFIIMFLLVCDIKLTRKQKIFLCIIGGPLMWGICLIYHNWWIVRGIFGFLNKYFLGIFRWFWNDLLGE